MGLVAGGIAGYFSGGWKGAIAGAVVGAAVGLVAPEGSAEAGASVGAMFASTAESVAVSAVGGGAATIASNWVTGQPLDQDLGYGVAIGALGPLASGEAFFIGAGGEAVFGSTAANGFGAVTQSFNIFGAALVSSKSSEHNNNCP